MARENVGTAYVRILADGTGLGKSIRDGLKDEDDSFRGAGKRSGKRYAEGMEEELSGQTTRKAIRDGLDKAFRRSDIADLFFKSPKWREFRTGMRENWKEIGEVATASLENEFRRGAIDFSGLTKRMDQVLPEIEKATRKITTAERERIKGLREEYKELLLDVERLNTGEGKANRTRHQAVRDLIRLRQSLTELNAVNVDVERSMAHTNKTLTQTHPRLTKINHEVDLFADVSGRAFGRGSRNNFLNFTGSLVRNLLRIPRLFTGVIGKISTFGRSISSAFTGANGGLVGFVAAIGAAGTGLLALVGGTTAAAVGLGVLLVIIGPMAAIFSGIAAAVTALAASLSFALIGAIGAVVGAFAPLVAGIAVVTAAFVGMDKAQKKALKASFKPVVKEFKALGDVARKPIFEGIRDSAKGLAPVVRSLRPLTRNVAEAVGDVFRAWSKGVGGPAFIAFRQSMRKFLPDAIRELGSIMGNTGTAMMGVFRGMIPLISEFLGWLDRVTEKFATWANSAEGRTAMRAFWDDVGDSVKSVGRFLREATVAVGELFRQGSGTGDSLFKEMADKLREFINYLRANKGSIADFFANGKSIAEGVGRAVQGIVDVFNALDSPATRWIATQMFAQFARSMGWLVNAVGAVMIAFGVLLQGIGNVASATGQFFQLLGKAPGFEWAGALGNKLDGLGDNIQHTGRELEVLGQLTVNPKIKDPTPKPKKNIQNLNEQLRITDKQKVSPKIDAKTKGAMDNFKAMQVKMRGVHGQKVNPRITADPSNALAGTNRVIDRLKLVKDKRIKVAVDVATGALNAALNLYNSLNDKQVDVRVVTHNISGANQATGGIIGMAAGGMANFEQIYRIGEAGREAIVPLDRPLGNIDPSVRWLAAIAQGKIPGLAAGRVMGGGKTVNVGGMTVVSNAKDPDAVARKVINELVGTGY